MRRRTLAATAALSTIALAGCSLGGGESGGSGSADSPSAAGSSGAASGSSGAAGSPANKTVTLVTHGSFAMSKELQAAFTKDTGYTVKISQSGDAGELANKLVLTKGSPLGDVVFGVDNTFASRVTSAGVLEDYSPRALPASAKTYALPDAAGARQLTPVDNASTCVNVDTTWFDKRNVAPPNSFDDLLKPEYKNLFVTPGAPTSSPGLAMLLATVGKYGDPGWQDYWKKLVANGAKITSGWEDAYNVDFTQGEGKGDRPIVWSYDTSPAFTVSGGRSTTKALLNTCFRQVEYAGVLKGAKNPAGARALVDWMVGKQFQAALPEAMYVFPVDSSVELPADWATFAKQPTDPIEVDPKQIAAKRQGWLRTWQDVTSQ